MSRVLVVDDKELMRDSVSTMLTRSGFTVQSVANAGSALANLSQNKPDAVLTDLQMPEMDGVELLREIRKFDEELPVVFMTAYGTVESAIEAIKLGAYDYIAKPFNGDRLVATIRRAIEHGELMRENAVLQSQMDSTAGASGRGRRVRRAEAGSPLIGRSDVMQRLRLQVERIAPSSSTVLICGESGAGKEVVAQLIHECSDRASKPLLAVNCAALPASLLESELFGHERGAFTGADKLRKGRFELADGGTLLLDEISEVPLETQAKLLRVLQERSFERVGSSLSQCTDVRVIATTNRDLSEEVAAGRFRQDLFYRLNVLPISVPPLRTHRDDIPELCAHFLSMCTPAGGQADRQFDNEALHLLMNYRWPGNVRELGNICERAALFAEDSSIRADVIRPWLSGATMETSHGAALGSDAPASPAPNGEMNGHHHFFSSRLGTTRFDETASSETGIRGNGIGNGIGNGNGHANAVAEAGHPFAPSAFDPERANNVDSAECEAAHIAIHPGKSLEEIEREVIVSTLTRNDGHRRRTARELGIGVRTLGLKLRKWKDLRLVAQDL